MNAALHLLAEKKEESLPIVLDIINSDPYIINFKPRYTPGFNFRCTEIIPAAAISSKEEKEALFAYTQEFLGSVLMETVDMPEHAFMTIAENLYAKKKHPLHPLLIHLLENHHSKRSIELLHKFSNKIGDPLSRRFARLALYRLSEDENDHRAFIDWLKKQMPDQMMTFKPTSENKDKWKNSCRLIEPEEEIAFFIEAYQTIAERKEKETLPILFSAIINGHPKNRPLFAALLLKAVQ